ncbi:hypothetical protein D1781_16905 [Amnibacterium setariae]|uniref:Uncharacterized protein n=1 Tax=Amnibacterium setariae TaxID=2306585 RepID=A0A3A1TSC0_9MICO|nr:hypothetical protein D1781_16905 [Amnibacterium setariae]
MSVAVSMPVPPPAMVGFAPEPYEPRVIGAPAAPDPLGVNFPLQVVPFLNRITSPAVKRTWVLTAESEAHGDCCVPSPFFFSAQFTKYVVAAAAATESVGAAVAGAAEPPIRAAATAAIRAVVRRRMMMSPEIGLAGWARSSLLDARRKPGRTRRAPWIVHPRPPIQSAHNPVRGGGWTRESPRGQHEPTRSGEVGGQS